MAGTAPTSGAAENGATDTLVAAHRAMRADASLQFQFPDYARPQPPPWANGLARFLQAIAPFLQIIFWTCVAAMAGLILFVLVREAALRWGLFERKSKPKAEAKPVPAFQPTATRARALLEEADRLAAEGRYSEAARVLLHRSIEDIERAYPVTIGPAATSREIARLEPLSPTGRDVFTRIAQAVETSLFGARPLDAVRFAECREAYASFAFGRER